MKITITDRDGEECIILDNVPIDDVKHFLELLRKYRYLDREGNWMKLNEPRIIQHLSDGFHITFEGQYVD